MKMIYLLIIVVGLGCGNVLNDDSTQTFSNPSILETKSVSLLASGTYGDLSIAVSGDTVTGVYEYYDKWNAQYKEFMDINLVYFFGRLNGQKITIAAGWPDGQKFKGTLTVGNEVHIKLDDQPNGYAAFDFVNDGYKAKKTKSKTWKQIAIVKATKTYLHKSPAAEKTKVYIVSNDIVKIVKEEGAWCYIEYTSPGVPDKLFNGWISKVDLYGIDPAKW